MFWQRDLARALKIIPRFLMGSGNRTKVKYLAALVPPWERDDFLYKNPVEPWAFIRVFNEIKTIRQSFNSFQGVIKKGVIAYHGCTDGTEEYIKEFCDKNPGFILFKYPYEVIPAHDIRYKGEIPYNNTLAAYYNAVLDLIPKGEWLIKIDADMLCIPSIFCKSFYLPSSENDMVIYSRLDLIRRNGDLFALNYQRPGDQWLIYNDGKIYFKNITKYTNKRFRAHEVLIKGNKKVICSECSWVHFPYEKAWRSQCDFEGQEIGRFLDSIPDYEMDKSFFNKEKLLEMANSFDK